MNKEDIEQQIHEFAEQMYETGYRNGQDSVETWQQTYKVGYERGLNDAWKCARKILFDYTLTDVKEKFGTDTFCGIIEKYSASETIAKIKEYEEKQNNEIKVGDEVKYCDACGEEVSGIVTNINADYPYAFVMNKNGEFSTVVTSKLFKTGRHFKEIEYVLKQ